MDSLLPIRCNFTVLVVLFNDMWRVDITLFVLKKQSVCSFLLTDCSFSYLISGS